MFELDCLKPRTLHEVYYPAHTQYAAWRDVHTAVAIVEQILYL